LAKSQGALILIAFFIGTLFFLAGLVFTLQGLGIVGPTSSFMFQSTTWINNGLVVLVIGIVILGVAFYFRARSKPLAKEATDKQVAQGDEKNEPGA